MDVRRSRVLVAFPFLLSLAMPTWAYVTVGGNITADTTWGRSAPAADGVYWVTTSVIVQGGATLDIEPGVAVKFAAAQGLTVGGTSVGFLTAV